MEPIVERGCGLDIGQAIVVACLLTGRPDQKPKKEVRTFRTLTSELLKLKDWLISGRCTRVAMESTGVYWKPIYAILEDAFELIVANAHHIQNVPGRKTDVKDSEWIAELLRHGLLKKSFVPPKPIRQLRDLLRYRRKVVEARSAERNRLLKLLEDANLKLASVISDVFGVSGLLMLKAILKGEQTSEQMAQLAKRRLRKKIPELQLALDGRVEEHHRFLLDLQIRRLEQFDRDIDMLDREIDTRLQPYREQQTLLMELPGVERVIAATLVAEIGVDMSVFDSAEHLAAWAGVCPGNNESAGKRKNAHSRRGNIHLKTALVEAADAAARTNGTYLKNKFHRLKARRGHKRAAVAVARKLLIAAYYMLSTRAHFRELGPEYLDRLNPRRAAANLVKRLQRLGFVVTIQRAAA
jgi:transposase